LNFVDADCRLWELVVAEPDPLDLRLDPCSNPCLVLYWEIHYPSWVQRYHSVSIPVADGKQEVIELELYSKSTSEVSSQIVVQ
jgi:hypothetical protein